ncbi:xaa-Pro aminopeptidase 2 [Stegastes partitus]|uniref:Xaa-Pro aminopeptidase 2 n=1 Tax=Stegastes partitus TaxID=144197 RepID=A0A9Y4MPV8_9TELE|nr:PREDICTED: xaa-Pro aminopeptidase 2 [Stegastes partitus]
MPSYGLLLALTLAALAGNTASAVAHEGTERNCSVIPPYLPSTAVNTTLQLQELRQRMRAMNIHGYIIPGTDAHLSEYIAPRDARVAFMTGFTGSAGTAVVTQTKAALWTDSRYWVQAERQMDCNWELEKDVSISSLAEWLISEVPPGGEIGFDPFLFSLKTQEEYAINLESSNRTLKSIPENLVDQVWKDRPAIPPDNLSRLPDRVIQRSWQTKVGHIRNQMRDNPYEPTALLLSALDETAWLFNMRGNDIPYNPFFYSYTLLTMDEIWVFLHMDRVTEELKVYLNASCNGPLCVQLKAYDTVLTDLKTYVAQPGVKVWIGTEYTNYALYEIITPQDKLMTSSYSPVLTTKAVKDETEQRILRDAHVRDAVAVIQLLMWLERAVPKGTESELSASEYVNKCRSKQADSRGPSFETISASGPNAALAHYRAPSSSTAFLFVWVCLPTGVNMEMLGRRALWEVGLNYGHGTGHGVGNYFGVHEWPVGFQSNNIAFRAGMFTSIEPGYYKDNDFGIRIEDIVVVVPVNTKYGHNYLTFDTVSLVPYDRKLINTTLLSSEQLQWLNNYYSTIRKVLGPELDKQKLKEEKDWMLKHTEPFSSASVCSSSLSLVALAIALLHNLA